MSDTRFPVKINSNSALAEHAAAIRRLGGQTVENIIEIGRHLVEAKAEVKKLGGSFDAWLKAEFNWSHGQAYNFINMFERQSELSKFDNSDLPISALYLLAAPSTPKEARDKVIERAEAGEPVSVAEVKQIVEQAKGRKPPAKRKPLAPRRSKSPDPAATAKDAWDIAALLNDLGPDSPREIARKLARLEELEPVARRLEIENVGLHSEVKDLRSENTGPASNGEIARKDAEIEELRNTKHRLEIKITGLESEVDEFQATIKKWEETVATQRSIIVRLENENAALRAKLETAQGAGNTLSSEIADAVTFGNPGPVPDFLRREIRND
jgi:hypothetical protein